VRESRRYIEGVKATLLYDADCGFCRWSTEKILRWDRRGRLRAVPLQSAEASALLPGMDETARMASFHLVDEDGVHSAGAAAAPLAKLLPLGAPVALIARAMPRTTERVYRWVANNRERLGKRLGEDACRVDPSSKR
jgi:predicted DCC family thiol-disulfide oxidoreductase YuxK